jgi:hypothetical protein
MHRNVTALYPSRSAAEAVCQELATIGLSAGSVQVVPATSGATGAGADVDPLEALAALELPEDDRAEYAARVRHGDVVVSAAVPEDRVDVVEAIMRRPSDPAGVGAAADPRARADAPYGSEPGGEGGLRQDRPSVLPEAGVFNTGGRRGD